MQLKFSWLFPRLWKLYLIVVNLLTIRGDEGSILIHIHRYLHKPLRKTKMAICYHQSDCPFLFWPVSDLMTCKDCREYGHRWHQMSLLRSGVIKKHKSQTCPVSVIMCWGYQSNSIRVEAGGGTVTGRSVSGGSMDPGLPLSHQWYQIIRQGK